MRLWAFYDIIEGVAIFRAFPNPDFFVFHFITRNRPVAVPEEGKANFFHRPRMWECATRFHLLQSLGLPREKICTV